MDEETRRSVCRLIAGVVMADDELDEAEDAFVGKLLERFELPADAREGLFPLTHGEEAAWELAAMAEDVRQQAFGLLVEAVAADKQYVAAERAYVHAVARVVGISAEEADAKVAAFLAD